MAANPSLRYGKTAHKPILIKRPWLPQYVYHHRAGSPSVLTNMPRSIEQHVDWISAILDHAQTHGIDRIEAESEAMTNWTDHVIETANKTLLPKANHSWYLGANIPGKPRVFMPYVGGLENYRAYCDQVTDSDYPGFSA